MTEANVSDDHTDKRKCLLPTVSYNISDDFQYTLLSVSDVSIFSAEMKIGAENTVRFPSTLEEQLWLTKVNSC